MDFIDRKDTVDAGPSTWNPTTGSRACQTITWKSHMGHETWLARIDLHSHLHDISKTASTAWQEIDTKVVINYNDVTLSVSMGASLSTYILVRLMIPIFSLRLVLKLSPMLLRWSWEISLNLLSRKLSSEASLRPSLISSKLARALGIHIAVIPRSTGSSDVSRNNSH